MMSAIDSFVCLSVKWYQENPDFWSDTSEDQGPIRGELEQTTNN